MIPQVSIVVVTNNFNNNLVTIVSQIVKIIVVVRSVPQFFCLVSSTCIDMISKNNFPAFCFSEYELIFKPVGNEGLLTAV